VSRTDQAPQRSAGEDRASWQGHPGEALTDVSVALCLCEGDNRRTYGDALGNVAQCIPVKTLLEFRLSEQYDLDELGGGYVQVHEKPELFKSCKRHAMGVIDQDCHIPVLPVCFQEVLLKRGLHRKAIQACGLQPTRLAQRRQECRKGDLRVGDDQCRELRGMALGQIGA
jgi:hypothetical protein